jgi:hydrogenase/urease accessory protein HupE
MNKILLGLICGLVFAIIDVLIMIPLKYETNRKRIEAMTAAFIERFMIGLLIPLVDLKIPLPASGLILGLMLSIPSAIITRAYAPIIGIGVVGGLIIGFIAG